MFGVDLVDFVNRENVWMVECGRGLCFLHETADAIAARARLGIDYLRRKNLQRDFTIEFCVIGKIDLTHAARAEAGANFVAADFSMRGERQDAHPGELMG